MSYETNVGRARAAEEVRGQVSVSTPVDEIREIAERTHGQPCSYTPAYHTMGRRDMEDIFFELEDALINLP